MTAFSKIAHLNLNTTCTTADSCMNCAVLLSQSTSSAPGYICNCNPGWQGTNCDQNINECSSNPCQNGGTCTDGINGFTCACTAQWTGPLCQTAQQGIMIRNWGIRWRERWRDEEETAWKKKEGQPWNRACYDTVGAFLRTKSVKS